MLKSTEWFIDAFPSIVGLTGDHEPVAELALDEQDPHEIGGNSISVELLQQECSGDEQLRSMCVKYCQVNKCQYTSGASDFVSPISGILPPDSPRLAAHLVAIFQFRHRFSVVPPQRQKTMSESLRWALTGPSKTDQLNVASSCIIAGLVRFHRPNCAQIFDSLFGPNQLPPAVWRWLSSSFLSACDGAITARELLGAFAATGSPASLALFAIAAIEEVLGSLPHSSAYAVNEAMSQLELCPELFVKLWRTASEMAAATPASAGDAFVRFATPFGRNSLASDNTIISVPSSAKKNLVSVLQVPPADVVLDLISSLREKQAAIGKNDADRSLEFSISGEGESGPTKVLSMACEAGAAIGSGLRAFSTNHMEISHDSAWVFVDARTGAERETDDSTAVRTRNEDKSGSSRKNSDLDWFADTAGPEACVSSSSSFSGALFVIYRIKKALFVDADINFGTENPVSVMFMQKLEFYRGNKICLIGEGSTAVALTARLLQKEFPFVCSVSGGFGALRNALLELPESTLREIAIIGSPPAAPAIKPSGSFFSRSNSEDLKAKLVSLGSSFFNNSAPARNSTTTLSVKQKATMPAFEIGDDQSDELDEDPNRLSSIDLSPTPSYGSK